MSSIPSAEAGSPVPPSASAASEGSAALLVEDVTVRYRNGAHGVLGVSFAVQPGQVIALFGPNGAGKTSCVRAASGFIRTEGARLTSGQVSVLGVDMSHSEPHRFHAAGIATVPERRKIFPRLSVADNLAALRQLPPRRQRRAAYDRVFDIFPVLATKRTALAGRLSGGQQQMLAIARALVCDPKVLLIDEMTLGLHHSLHAPLFDAVTRVASTGTAIVLVDESTGFAIQTASYCYLLSGGVIRDQGPAEMFRGGELLAAGYVEG